MGGKAQLENSSNKFDDKIVGQIWWICWHNLLWRDDFRTSLSSSCENTVHIYIYRQSILYICTCVLMYLTGKDKSLAKIKGEFRKGWCFMERDMLPHQNYCTFNFSVWQNPFCFYNIYVHDPRFCHKIKIKQFGL